MEFYLTNQGFTAEQEKRLRRTVERHGDQLWSAICDTFHPGSRILPRKLRELRGYSPAYASHVLVTVLANILAEYEVKKLPDCPIIRKSGRNGKNGRYWLV